jgi:hypothetical protein
MKTVFYFAGMLLLPALGMAQDGSTTTTTQQTTTMPGNATINMSIGGTGMTGSTTQQTTTTITTTTTTNGGDMTQQAPPPLPQQQAAPSQGGCQAPMFEEDYQSAKRSIEEKTFEDTKLTLAKQIAGANCLSAGQIRGIMKEFTYENSKLDFAKFAYAHCCDKANYYKVDDAFDFDNSSKELNDYISKQ